jgi:hypothetical protein
VAAAAPETVPMPTALNLSLSPTPTAAVGGSARPSPSPVPATQARVPVGLAAAGPDVVLDASASMPYLVPEALSSLMLADAATAGTVHARALTQGGSWLNELAPWMQSLPTAPLPTLAHRNRLVAAGAPDPAPVVGTDDEHHDDDAPAPVPLAALGTGTRRTSVRNPSTTTAPSTAAAASADAGAIIQVEDPATAAAAAATTTTTYPDIDKEHEGEEEEVTTRGRYERSDSGATLVGKRASGSGGAAAGTAHRASEANEPAEAGPAPDPSDDFLERIDMVSAMMLGWRAWSALRGRGGRVRNRKSCTRRQHGSSVSRRSARGTPLACRAMRMTPA